MVLEVKWLDLKPFFLLKVEYHTDFDNQDCYPEYKIAPGPGKLWYMRKVHTIYSDNKSHGNKNRGNYGKHLHNLVHPVTDTGKVNIKHP